MFKPLLHHQLTGSTCYLSRIKNHGYQIGWQPFVTLHSLVYKVLRRTTVGRNIDTFHDQLVGSEMKSLVNVTLTRLFKFIPTEEQVEAYYLALRQYLNSICSINQIEHGQQFLTMYLQLKHEGLDWEESLQLATYYLKNNHVNEIEKFEFDNVILLNYEVLSQPRNKNAMEFFKALCDWNKKRNAFNIYVECWGKLHLCQQVTIQESIKLSNPFERQV